MFKSLTAAAIVSFGLVGIAMAQWPAPHRQEEMLCSRSRIRSESKSEFTLNGKKVSATTKTRKWVQRYFFYCTVEVEGQPPRVCAQAYYRNGEPSIRCVQNESLDGYDYDPPAVSDIGNRPQDVSISLVEQSEKSERYKRLVSRVRNLSGHRERAEIEYCALEDYPDQDLHRTLLSSTLNAPIQRGYRLDDVITVESAIDGCTLSLPESDQRGQRRPGKQVRCNEILKVSQIVAHWTLEDRLRELRPLNLRESDYLVPSLDQQAIRHVVEVQEFARLSLPQSAPRRRLSPQPTYSNNQNTRLDNYTLVEWYCDGVQVLFNYKMNLN